MGGRQKRLQVVNLSNSNNILLLMGAIKYILMHNQTFDKKK